MTGIAELSGSKLARLTMVAAVLLPGTSAAPGPDELDGYDELLQRACTALAREWDAINSAIEELPADITWDIPSGRRRAAPLDQAANELGDGLLDAVMERKSPVLSLEDVNSRSVTL